MRESPDPPPFDGHRILHPQQRVGRQNGSVGSVDFILDDLDRVELSVTVSPLATVMTSVVEVFGTLTGRLPQGVQQRVRTLSRQLDLTPLEPLFTRQRRSVPEGLLPVIAGRSTFSQELELVRAESQGIAAEIAQLYPTDVPEYFQPWLEDPARAMDRYLRALHTYHEVVIRRIYPDLEQRLHRESAILQRAVDSGDHHWTMAHLHPRFVSIPVAGLRWDSCMIRENVRVRTKRLTLVPMVCDPNTVSSNVFPFRIPPQIQLRFASPNLAVYAEHARPHGAADPLAALIGLPQARILRHLRNATTTTELANDLNLAPSTVSQHLRNLLASDTLHAHRHGRCVYYRLTDRGHDLLHLYGTMP